MENLSAAEFTWGQDIPHQRYFFVCLCISVIIIFLRSFLPGRLLKVLGKILLKEVFHL